MPRRGIIVSEINVTSQLRLLEVRRELERLIASSAARRATDDERDAFRRSRRAFEAAAKANDDVNFMRIDRDFNVLCSAAAHNEFAAGAMSLMHSLSRRFWYLHYKQAADMPLTAKLHADIARAIADGDEERAAKATDRLLDADREVHPQHREPVTAAAPQRRRRHEHATQKDPAGPRRRGAALAAQPYFSFPALAQNRPLRIGIIAPKAGIAGTIGECGLRGTMFAVDRINAAGGIAGRKVELVVEEETNPKDSIERLRKLVLQDKVDCVQGIVSSGVSLAMGAVAEEMKALLIFWDGTTQDGVNETMPNPRYVFRSTDNECEAVMGSLLAIKHWKGKFATVAGINPDYSYGRNNFAAFQALMKKFGVEHKVVADQWPKVGTLDLTSHVAALKAAKPDLIFSSLLFADLPVFMKTAHGAGLMDGKTKFVFPAAGFQHTLLKKEFTPEGMIFGHNTLYFDHRESDAAAEAVRAGVRGQVQGLSALGSRPRLLRDADLPAPASRRPTRRRTPGRARKTSSARWKA